MGIEKFIKKIAVQTAVYWGNPTDDGYGGKTYYSPVEISVRWENTNELITTADGEQYACIAKIFVTQDVKVNAYIYLGDFDDIDSDEGNPKSVEGAYRIRRFDKIPMIKKTDEFVRLCYI